MLILDTLLARKDSQQMSGYRSTHPSLTRNTLRTSLTLSNLPVEPSWVYLMVYHLKLVHRLLCQFNMVFFQCHVQLLLESKPPGDGNTPSHMFIFPTDKVGQPGFPFVNQTNVNRSTHSFFEPIWGCAKMVVPPNHPKVDYLINVLNRQFRGSPILICVDAHLKHMQVCIWFPRP